MTDYNYDNFSHKEYDLSNFTGPLPGEKAPDAILQTPNGSPHRLLDFASEFLVIELGSVTCPLFQSRRKTMAGLSKAHPLIEFVVLYIREAHPGAKIRQHQSLKDKISNAQKLDDGSGDQREILVDDIKGSTHQAYGGFPNAVYIVNSNGCIVFSSDWNDAEATGKALELLLAGKAANVRSFFKPAKPGVGMKTFKQSGKGAGRDFLMGFPVLFWQNMIKRNWRVLWGKQALVKPNSHC